MFWFGRGIARHFMKQERRRVSPTEYLILTILHKKGKKTASEIIEYLESQFRNVWQPKPGTIYPILTKLEKKEYIKSFNSYPKIYSITDSGKGQINFLSSIFNNEIQFFEKFAQFVSGTIPDFSMLDKILGEKLEGYKNWLNDELKRVEIMLKSKKSKNNNNESKDEGYEIPIN